jgi:hypothetical protein
MRTFLGFLLWLALAATALATPPSVVQTSNGAASTSSTVNQVVTLPSTVNPGDLLVAALYLLGAPNNQSGPTDWPAGWTLSNDTFTGANEIAVYYRIADGSEDGGSVAVTASQGSFGNYIVYRITGADPSAMPTTPAALLSVGSSSTIPFPSVTPAWAAADDLFIAFFGSFGASPTSVTSWPTNYTDNQIFYRNSGSNAYITGGATRGATVPTGTETPGNLTLNAVTTLSRLSVTIAVKPQIDYTFNLPMLGM